MAGKGKEDMSHTHDIHDGENHVVSTKYDNEATRLNYLRTIYAPNKEAPQAFRSPGTFIAEFVFNGLSFDQIVAFLSANPATAYCACCMDERVKMKKGGRFITSHEGCGAAAKVYGALKANPDLQARMAAVIGAASLRAALESSDKDEIGKLWSKALAKAVGVGYAHLPVDYEHHYSTMAVLDAAGCFLGDTPGAVGKRSFIVSNTEFLGNQDQSRAYDLMIQYGFLALEIARGHSTIAGKDDEYPFTILVTRDANFDEKLFKQRVDVFVAAQKEKNIDYSTMNYKIAYLDEAKLAA